ncbi:sensor histidine kinase [Miltoncostaea marina]|uniref:sensor histidine kinase n=1 Tax=Miltoncostaea marina TaxID=2843215 RepID=UPI001C3CE2C8|nr:HAMP domain-containing sensor histidine kinase [Miltoncostaea marina]
MTRRLVATYLVLATIVLVALEIPLGVSNARNQRQDLQQRVERDAVALAALVEDRLQAGAAPGDATLGRIVGGYAAGTGARVVVTGPTGVALADSDAARELGRDFSTRPEVAAALDGRVATGTRSSETLGRRLLYVAVPVASGGVVHGVVRATVPTSRIDALVRRYWLALAGIAAVVLLAVTVTGRWLARWVSRPLVDLRDATRRAEGGDLGVRADAAAGPGEVRELAAAFNDMVTRLDAMVGAQEQFVADASHQLRSPLTALRLRIENLQHATGGQGDEDVEGALAEVDRLSRLVDGLLALTRAERSAARRSPQDVGALVGERADAWRLAAAEAGVELTARVDGAPRALLSEGALEQVLDNLIANAIAAAPSGGRVVVAAGPRDGGARVTVTDDGPGMDAAQRERAFDRFWRAGGDRAGSGLGLAIVRRLVGADGGTVALQEADGGGLRAVVDYPAAARAAARR